MDSRAAQRVPTNHRSAASSCPRQRAAVSTTDVCACAGDAGCRCGSCARDSDCTAGPNGRCVQAFSGSYFCSYDACFAESDCDGGLPCGCRASAASAQPNVCLTQGNCLTDSDCGPNGYCSPSDVLDSCACASLSNDAGSCYVGSMQISCTYGDFCGHGYFCHTARDTCIDDCDCGSHGLCLFDVIDQRWDCPQLCIPPG